MVGLRGPSGRLIRKLSAFGSNSEILVSHLKGLKCDGTLLPHDEATGANLRKLQEWSWQLARPIADGIVDLVVWTQHKRVQTYPIDDDARAVGEAATAKPDCLGCRRHLRRDDPLHTRIEGQYKFLHDGAKEWTCPGCMAGRFRGDFSHTY